MGDTGIWGWQIDRQTFSLSRSVAEDIEEPDQLQSTMVQRTVTSLNSHHSNVNLDTEPVLPSTLKKMSRHLQ